MAGDEPRKASDIILELEQKVDMLLKLQQASDFNIKVLSNKLNQFLANKAQPSFVPSPMPQPSAQPGTQSDFVLPGTENRPVGVRRGSRVEEAESEKGNNYTTPSIKVELPGMPENSTDFKDFSPPNSNQTTGPEITVSQRIVDANSKALFMTNISIHDQSGNVIGTTKTNAIGKWTTKIPPGKYRVRIEKAATLTKSKVDVVQDLEIDGSKNPLELKLAIIK